MKPILSAGKNLLDFLLNKEPAWPLERVSEDDVRTMLGAGFESAVGLSQTAALFAGRLGIEVKPAAQFMRFSPGQKIIVGEYDRNLCDENVPSFPPNARIDWFLITCLESINYQPA